MPSLVTNWDLTRGLLMGLSWLPWAAGLALPASYVGAMLALNGRRRAGEPPLIRGAVPGLGVALGFGRHATNFVMRTRERYGETFTLFIGGQRMTFVLDPMSTPAVLKSPHLSFHPISDKVLATAFKLSALRDGRDLDLEAIEDLARSRLKGDALAAMTAAMAENLRATVPAALPPTYETRGLYRLVWDLMFAAGTDALFGRGLANEALARAFATFDEQFPLMVAGLPSALIKKGNAALDTLAAAPPMGETPSAWIRDRHPHFDGVAPEIYGRAQASIMWAVNANTIPATFWSLYYLLRDEAGLTAVREELAELSDTQREQLDTPTLDGLRMLDSSIREALRLSSGSMTIREALDDFELETRDGTWSIRKGDRVVLAPFITHRDPEIYPDPECYQADRFFIERGVKQFFKGGKRVPLPLMPFGAGVSMCPGRFFAINEIKLFVARALLDWEIEVSAAPAPDFDFSRAGLGIYPPVHDVEVRARRRA